MAASLLYRIAARFGTPPQPVQPFREKASGPVSDAERALLFPGRAHELGRWAEDLTAEFLKRQGLQILGRNLHFGRSELDIICTENEQLVVVEVRCRRENPLQRAEETLNSAKKTALLRGARRCVTERGWQGNWRIDLVALCVSRDSWTLNWYRGVDRNWDKHTGDERHYGR